MHVTRFDHAPSDEISTDVGMQSLLLQGCKAGPSTQMWMGMSRIQPGGHTMLDAPPTEEFWLVLEGELHVLAELDGRRDERLLGPYDSCRLAPGEKRQLFNRSNRPALVARVMPTAAPAV